MPKLGRPKLNIPKTKAQWQVKKNTIKFWSRLARRLGFNWGDKAGRQGALLDAIAECDLDRVTKAIEELLEDRDGDS